MPSRFAACLSLIVFAVCLVVGGVEAGNPFTTTVIRALLAMAFTYVIGLILGTMAARMLDENLKAEAKKIENFSNETAGDDR